MQFKDSDIIINACTVGKGTSNKQITEKQFNEQTLKDYFNNDRIRYVNNKGIKELVNISIKKKINFNFIETNHPSNWTSENNINIK